MHGYELKQRLTALSGYWRIISDGTLYPALQRLHDVLQLASHVLARDPSQFVPQLLGRVADPQRDLGLCAPVLAPLGRACFGGEFVHDGARGVKEAVVARMRAGRPNSGSQLIPAP